MVVSDLLRFLQLRGWFLWLKLLASVELGRHQLSFLRVQLPAAAVSCHQVVFVLGRQLFQFLFDGDEIWTILKLVLFFRRQELSQLRIAR